MSEPALAAGPTGLPPTAPPTTEYAVALQQQATAAVYGATLATVLAIWASLDVEDPFTSWFSGAGDETLLALTVGQQVAAERAHDYLVQSLLSQGIVADVPRVDPTAFAGRASDGRELDTLLLQPVVYVAAARQAGQEPAAALAHGEFLLRRIVQLQIADAAREAVQAVIVGTDALDLDLDEVEDFDELEREVYRRVEDDAAAARVLEEVERIVNDAALRDVVRDAERFTRNAARRFERGESEFRRRRAAPKVGWIRVLTPPSCGRCALLAGKWYGWNEGFQRHDNCDCIHLPTTVVASSGMTVNVEAYFDALDEALQDELFGKAVAQAIRDGADPAQVINATGRGGMYVADGGRQYTTEGTTRRGSYRRSDGGAIGARRPTPLQIYRDAADQDEARFLLRRFGYLID